MKKRYIILALAILAALVLGLVFGCSKSQEYLQIRVQSIQARGDDQLVTLQYDNRTGAPVAFGWVGSCKIRVTTDQGAYTLPVSWIKDIPQGTSQVTLTLRNCPGTVEQITFTELVRLNEQGLPKERLQDVRVFQSSMNLNTFQDSFGFFDDPDWFHSCIPFLVGCVFVLAFLKALAGLFLGGKLPKFPFGGDHHNWQQMDMANQMHQEAVATHQRMVDQQIHQQAADFGMRSVTPIEAGGFVPTPPTFDPPSFF